VHQLIRVGLPVLGLVVGAAVTRRTGGSRWTRAAGVVVMLVAAWLFPQRRDIGALVIDAALFGAGLGLAFPRKSDRDHRLLRRVAATVTVVAVFGFGAYVGAETPTAHWFGGGITHGPTHTRAVALTFDDGPNVTATLGIMKILDDADVKGTFFEVGKAIDAEPQITRALYEHGQLLGNHSYEHDQWRWLDPRYPELERTQKAFRRAIGVCPAYYRPPHGDRTPFIAHVVNDHHMRIVMWNVSATDWSEKSARTIARRIVGRAKPGAIILLHDGLDGLPKTDRTVLVRALPLILEGLREKNLRPVGLDELIGGPAYVPC
jgi:peptidoglycan/xylan/chitin deacetylase (PgdA/CDA1 family)